jgi:nitroreductase / dihydropteridine reductase
MASQTLQQLQWRYATKKFDPDRQLSEEQLHILKESFNLTATSYGLQPIKLVVIQNKELQSQLLPHTMNQIQVRDASHVLVFCIQTEISGTYIKNYFNNVEAIRETPRSILKPFELFLLDEFANKDPKDIDMWMTKQAYLAMGNLLTVCAYEKIDACPIEGFEPERYDDVLNLKSKNLRSVLVMPIGYRAEDDFMASLKKVRKGVDEVIIEM